MAMLCGMVHHGSGGIAREIERTVLEKGMRLITPHITRVPASTATTGRESTITLIIMIHTAAQCSEKYYHRRKVRRQRELAACQTPCETTSAAATDLHALDCHETAFCCGYKNIKRLVLYHSTSRYVRHPQKILSTRLVADISTPYFIKPFRDCDSETFFR